MSVPSFANFSSCYPPPDRLTEIKIKQEELVFLNSKLCSLRDELHENKDNEKIVQFIQPVIFQTIKDIANLSLSPSPRSTCSLFGNTSNNRSNSFPNI